MAKVLVCYYSRGGNTERMSRAVAEGAAQAKGAEVTTKAVADVRAKDLLGYDELWAAAGTPRAVFRLTPDDLVRIADGQVVRIQ